MDGRAGPPAFNSGSGRVSGVDERRGAGRGARSGVFVRAGDHEATVGDLRDAEASTADGLADGELDGHAARDRAQVATLALLADRVDRHLRLRTELRVDGEVAGQDPGA